MGAARPGRSVVTLGMLEAQLQTNVVDAARQLGGKVYHTYDSRRSAAGYPDLTIAFPANGTLIFVELKSARGRVTDDQRAWHVALADCGVDVFVWRPEHWPDPITDVLLTAAGRRRAGA
jgi:hypothetical protein